MIDTIKTVDDIMASEPCDDYTRQRVSDLVGDGITAAQCATLDIPIEDRLWGLINAWMDDRQRRLLACDCAERALLLERDAGREPDKRSWEAIRVARAYAWGGATDEDLAAAWYAAGDATRDGARDAELRWQIDRALAYVRGEVE
jgi:hypothetical protein